ncbi:hypothetical protein SAMN04487830_13222 [Pseudobutyrivibrio sp. OR37]|uniref:Wadjet anti-phage system protein JetD domain-containing protein n=1 Tax=Pseudobutyrivibrio sp. OR37 TaxID=1798186 RepID=UPI0008EB4634|nr:Wadjet anti-phage system protein JetD domain-containing protein [Pseudobutyrivibrio sp. OR37]SFI23094.1 hypothetical protein SAMN04487830_13222 [Pseudobutyrivibrio sp. OR37]
MWDKLSKTQKTVINKLIDKYERSKLYTGDCKVNRNIFLLPTEVFTDYDSDFADVEKVSQFEDELRELDEKGLIEISYDTNYVVKKILSIPEKWDMYYSLLGRVTKKHIIVEQTSYLEDVICNNKDDIILKFCEEQLQRLQQGKKPSYNFDDLKNIVELIETIIGNKTTLLERELSILKFGDSKEFEKRYKSRICSILRKYGNYEERLDGIDVKSEVEHIILEEHMIFANPSYIYFKGNGRIMFHDGHKISLNNDISIGLISDAISDIKNIEIYDDNIVTIENLTSFNRYFAQNTFSMYLAGYHNSAKTNFLKLINQHNQRKNWYHFGDLDPDGFYILEHLKTTTNIDFESKFMNAEYLKKYKQYTKELAENDKVKAKNLIESGKYKEVLEYMLENNCKLEQEIISLEEINEI